MGKVRSEDESLNIISTDALDDFGYILSYDKTNKVYKKGSPCATWLTVGIARTSTLQPSGNPTVYAAVAGQAVALDKSGIVEVKLLATNAAIEIWDPIKISTNTGKADKLTLRTDTLAHWVSDMQSFVGYAQQAKGASVGGHLNVLLKLPQDVTA